MLVSGQPRFGPRVHRPGAVSRGRERSRPELSDTAAPDVFTGLIQKSARRAVLVNSASERMFIIPPEYGLSPLASPAAVRPNKAPPNCDGPIWPPLPDGGIGPPPLGVRTLFDALVTRSRRNLGHATFHIWRHFCWHDVQILSVREDSAGPPSAPAPAGRAWAARPCDGNALRFDHAFRPAAPYLAAPT